MAKEFKLPYTASEINEKLEKIDNKADLIDGKIPASQLPETVASKSDLDNAISVIDSLLASAIGSGVLT